MWLQSVTEPYDPEEKRLLERVYAHRSLWESDTRSIAVVDFGSGKRSVPTALAKLDRPPERKISDIYKKAAIPDVWGQFLFRLVRARQPQNVLELGTNLGVSAAYIQTGLFLNGGATDFTTIEGDPTLANLAGEWLAGLEGTVSQMCGSFRETLPEYLISSGPIDLAFIDGHHDESATLEYVDLLWPHLAAGALLIFDDTEPWAAAVRRAWKRTANSRPDLVSVDLVKMGLLFLPDNVQES